MIQGLLHQQAEAIIYVKLGNAEINSYKYDPMSVLLDRWETINKKITLIPVAINGKIYLFAISIDGMLGRESLAMIAQFS